MAISGFLKSSLVDFPGLISGVMFLSGCNYNCFYCHNRNLIEHPTEVLSFADIIAFLKRRIHLLDGVVITGGEPTLDPNLKSYIKTIKQLGFRVKLDTNGSSPKVIQELLDEHLCDYYAVDYKAPAHKQKEFCGGSIDSNTVLKTIQLLQDYSAKFEVRTTVFPQLQPADLLCMARELPIVPKYCLNRYRKPENFLMKDKDKIQKKPYTQTEIEKLVHLIQSVQPNACT